MIYQVRRALYVSITLVLSSCSMGSDQPNLSNPWDSPSLAAGQAASQTNSAANKDTTLEVLVAPGFEIEMKSTEDSALNGKYQVDNEGKIRLPYAVTVQVSGLNANGLQQRVASTYAPFYHSTSHIKVRILEARVFLDIGGLVQKPGHYLVRSNASLDEVIGAAGGLLQNGDRALVARFVRVEQQGQSNFVPLYDYYSGTQTFQFEWRGGEKVFLQSEGGSNDLSAATRLTSIQILGQVKNPGEYKLQSSSDFFLYLSKAGGPTAEADLEKIQIIRFENDKKRSLEFSLREIDKMPAIQGGDIVMVLSNKSDTTINNFAAVVGAISAAIIAAFAI